MLRVDDKKVRELLFCGNFGLEKESLRVTGGGFFSHTKHPFPGDNNIVRDFCENQIEINTGVSDSASGAILELEQHTKRVYDKLSRMTEPEYLWPFSNPPYIKSEEDIPIAQFTGKDRYKTVYREYLADTYGRYKMTLSGIHVNYSFADELLYEGFSLTGERDFRAYKDNIYLKLAKGMTAYGWLITLLLAASPVSDGSYVDTDRTGEDVFLGMASLRCSELGYWNYFVPVLSYDSAYSYAKSIQSYIDEGFITSQTEVYYPIRLKPKGINSLESLETEGINHIEIRNVDLNPFAVSGIDERDLRFIQLLILYVISLDAFDFTGELQIKAAANFKNAAHYDIDAAKIFMPDGSVKSVKDAALSALGYMKEFYRSIESDVNEVIEFQEDKLKSSENRYSARVLAEFSQGYVEKGMELAKRQPYSTEVEVRK